MLLLIECGKLDTHLEVGPIIRSHILMITWWDIHSTSRRSITYVYLYNILPSRTVIRQNISITSSSSSSACCSVSTSETRRGQSICKLSFCITVIRQRQYSIQHVEHNSSDTSLRRLRGDPSIYLSSHLSALQQLPLDVGQKPQQQLFRSLYFDIQFEVGGSVVVQRATAVAASCPLCSVSGNVITHPDNSSGTSTSKKKQTEEEWEWIIHVPGGRSAVVVLLLIQLRLPWVNPQNGVCQGGQMVHTNVCVSHGTWILPYVRSFFHCCNVRFLCP